MTLADLPSPDTSRWVARRKAEVVAAVNGGLLTMAEACERYQMDLEELVSWQRAIDRNGLSGLKAKGLQKARRGRG
jgi:mannose/fructose-specific phosphotransferase system component IIA